MLSPLRRRLLLAASLGCLLERASAQPAPVARIIVPLGTGNQFDTSARVLAESMSRVTGRTYIVENKPGAGGGIGAMEVAKARPDGLTLLVTTAGHVTNAVLQAKTPYRPVADFTPITMMTQSSGFVLCVRSESPWKTAQDFIAAARAQPGKLSYGSYGVGNTTHVVGALFAKGAGVELIHVPYRSPMSDFLGGHVDSVFVGETTVRSLLNDGKLRALAISAGKRSPTLPGVPTFAELGVKDADVPAWSGLFGPRGMPAALVQEVFQQLQEAAKQPEYLANHKLTGAELMLMPPDKFSAYLEAEHQRLRQLLPPLGIQME